jgi:PAS domain S-box-containing protein
MEKKLLKDLVEYLPCGAIYLQGDQVVLNRLAEWLTGYSNSEIIDIESWLQKISGGKSSDFRKHFECSQDRSPRLVEIVHRSGELRCIEISFYRTGQVELWLMKDLTSELQSESKINSILTEKKITEQQLKESKTRLELALSSNGIGTFTLYFKEEKLDLDSQVTKIFDLSGSLHFEEANRMISLRLFEEDRARLHQKLQMTMLKDKPFNERFRIRWPNGEMRHLQSQAKVIRDPMGEPVLLTGVVWDITDEIRAFEALEAQKAILINSAKMATLGEMSGGIAHEINNPLSIIKGRADQLQGYIENKDFTESKLLAVTEAINRMCDRITRIVRGLRTFARDGQQDPYERTSVKKLIEESLNLCREKFLNHGVKIETFFPAQTVEIWCQQVQLEQAILNLLSNAYDAVKPLENKWIKIHLENHSEFVEILISDSGPGIRREIADKIMQPFFTTKEVGQGTGLGLSIANGIVEAHGGSLSLDLKIPNTQFKIRLPTAKKDSKTG